MLRNNQSNKKIKPNRVGISLFAMSLLLSSAERRETTEDNLLSQKISTSAQDIGSLAIDIVAEPKAEYRKHDVGVPNIFVQTPRVNTDRLEVSKYVLLQVLPPIKYFETWVKIADCESTLKWAIDTGNGFEGGLQFTQDSWEGAGGLNYAPSPKLATPAEQMVTAEVLLDLQGPNAWPLCGRFFKDVL